MSFFLISRDHFAMMKLGFYFGRIQDLRGWIALIVILDRYYFNFNNLAFIATTTVLKLIKTAPIAGLRVKYG